MKNLNIAGKIARQFYDSKITILIIVSIIFAGIGAVFITPRMYNPEIKVPAASIIVMRPNTPAWQMENEIVKPLEGVIGGIYGVDHTFSYAVDDMAVTTVQFKVGQSQDLSMIRLYNKIMRNYDRMPKGTFQPIIKSVGVEDIPIITVSLSSDKLTPYQLRNLACKFLNEIRGIPDAGSTNVIGGAPKEINVKLNPTKLAAYHISLSNLEDTIKASGIFLKTGDVVENNSSMPVYVEHLLNSKEDIENIIVGSNKDRPIYLKDIAGITYGAEETNYITRFGFGKASHKKDYNNILNSVTITIAKKRGANAVFVAQKVFKRIKYLKKTLLPEDVNLTIMRNYANKANTAVNTLIEHLIIAIIAVGIILLIFLGLKAALVVSIMVPLVLLLTILIGSLAGETINRISLFALILSLGLLVDGGIVVIENIHRHMKDTGKKLSEKIILATNEIGNPTNIATIAVIVAFIPMAFVGGMMGPFMRPIPINVPIAMITSLFLAYSIVPYGSYFIYKKQKITTEKETKREFLQIMYKKTLIPLMRSKAKRITLYIAVFILLIASIMIFSWQFIRPQGLNGQLSSLGVEFKMLPNSNVDTFLVEVKLPLNSALEKTQSISEKAAMLIGNNPYVYAYQIYTGCQAPLNFSLLMRSFEMQNTPNISFLKIKLAKENRPKTHKIVLELDKKLQVLRKQYPKVKIKIIESPPGPPTRANVLAQIYGPNYKILQHSAQLLEHKFDSVYGITNIDSSVYPPYRSITLKVDYHKAILSGVYPDQIAKQLHDLISGVKITLLHNTFSSEPIYVILRLPKLDRDNANSILNIYIKNSFDKMISLREIVKVVKTKLQQPIYSRDQHNVVYVEGDMIKSSPVYAVLYLNKEINNKKLKNSIAFQTSNLGLFHSLVNDVTHYQLRWGGDMRLTLDVFRDLGLAFIAALLFIYFLLVGYYKSFILPLIVMGPIPLTIIGIFPGHLILNQPFTATSMIGVIALAGIVIRNSLLLIDFILDHIKKGHALTYSIVETGAVRFRPILLTALAIIFGSFVMISDPIFGGLAISLIFGTLASTLLSLILIPLLYFSLRKLL